MTAPEDSDAVAADSERDTETTSSTPTGEWRAGTARRCITPDEPLWLYGYASEDRFAESTGVFNDLYAKALALADPDGNRAVLVSVDLCAFRKTLGRAIKGYIRARTSLSDAQILLNLSHTHSGPLLGQPLPAHRYPVGDDQRRQHLEYTEWIQQEIADAAVEAMSDLSRTTLSWGVGHEPGFVTNRRQLDKDGNYTGMGPNPDGPIDPAIPVLRVDGSEGEPAAIVFGCACHNVTLDGSNLLVSTDYSGFAAEQLEETYPTAEAMFITGCAGDANPEPRGGSRQHALAREHGASLATEIEAVLQGALHPVTGELQTSLETSMLPLQYPTVHSGTAGSLDRPKYEQYDTERVREAINQGHELPDVYPAPVSCWQLGDVTLVGLPGEAVSEYAHMSESVVEADHLWIAGYCNEVFGYLPTKQIIDEGGYETRGLLEPGIGQISPAAEGVLLETIESVTNVE